MKIKQKQVKQVKKFDENLTVNFSNTMIYYKSKKKADEKCPLLFLKQESGMENQQDMKIEQRNVDVKTVVDLALEAGRILLKNGGEIFRVEETITRICNHFGVEKVDIFTLSHGLFVSAENENGEVYTRVKHIPLSGSHLGIVADVNELSRQIAEGKVTIHEATERLKMIDQTPPLAWYYQILGAGLGSGGFGFLLGASMTESLMAFCIGCVVYLWVLEAKRVRVSKIIVNIVGGIIITAMALGAREICTVVTLRLDGMIIGGIMSLVPGLAFTNAIRDVADGDFLSGTVRMIDALLVFVYIAIGVGLALKIYSNMPGGLLV